MFEKEFIAISTATPETLWPYYADVARWALWDASVERVSLDGAFAAGTAGTLELRGKPALRFELLHVTPFVSFADVTQVGPMTVRFEHELARLIGGTRITHRVRIEGPGAEALGEAMHVQDSVDALARLGAKGQPVMLGGLMLYVPDVAKTVAFYEAAFGFRVVYRGEGGVYVQMAGPVPLAFGAESFMQKALPLATRPSRPDQEPLGAEVMLVVADVPQAYERAISAGAVALVAPEKKPWGQIAAFVRDCDGTLVELCTPW